MLDQLGDMPLDSLLQSVMNEMKGEVRSVKRLTNKYCWIVGLALAFQFKFD